MLRQNARNKRLNGAQPRTKGKNGSTTNGNGNANRNGNGNRMNGKPQNGVAQSMALNTAYNNVRAMNNNTRIERGTDFVTAVTVRGTPTREQRILISQDISPSAFPGTRITQLSQLFERYRFRSMSLRWVPAVPTTLACQFLLYVDTDPLDDPTDAGTTDVLIRQATAQTGSQQWNFNVAKRIPMALRKDDQLYYTGDTKVNPRFSLMGRAYLIQVTNPVNFNGESITEDFEAGTLYIDWVCEFQTPQINPAGYLSSQSSLLPSEYGEIEIDPFEIPAIYTLIADPTRRNKQFVYTITTTLTSDWTNATAVTSDGSIRIRQDDNDPVSQSNSLTVWLTAAVDSWRLGGLAAFAFGQFDQDGSANFIVDVAGSTPTGSGGLLKLVYRRI